MIVKRLLYFLAFLFVLITPLVASAQYLLQQPQSGTVVNGYPSFKHVPPAANDTYIADDFTTGGQTWTINRILIPGTFRSANGYPDPDSSYSTLSNATALHWEIWADNSGVPAGNPTSGTPVWSLSVPPTDPKVTIQLNSLNYGSNVILDITATPLNLTGTYWLIFYPEINALTYAQYCRLVSTTTLNGYDAQIIVPGGTPPAPTSWIPMNTVPDWSELVGVKDVAFFLEGTTGEPAPILSLSPASLAFGSVQVGQASAAQQVTVSNTGNASMNVTSILSTGTDNTMFSVAVGGTNPCANLTPTIAAGANCTVNVTFTPSSAGGKTASLSVSSNGGNGTVSLGGTGIAPLLSLSPASLAFGSVQVGQASAAQQVTVSNTGNASMNVTSILSTGTDNTMFSVAVGGTNPCANLTPTIAAGANCTVNVTFTPSSAGGKTASLSVSSNGGNGTVSLGGTGVAPILSLSPASLAFGSVQVGQASAAQQVTVSNTGNASMNVTSILSTGTDNTMFSVAVGGTNPCANLTPTIAAGANCTVNVTFTPSSAGGKTASLSVSSNGGNGTVPLSGTGTAPGISVTPAGPINFGSIQTSLTSTPTQVTISNTGVGPLNVSGITLGGTNPGEFAVATGGTRACATLAPTIPASDYCTVNVTFTPTTVGNKAASLTVTSNASPAGVTLEGIGINPNISVAPVGPIDFGSALISQTSAPTQVTISNTGTTPLVVGSIGIGGANATMFAVAVGGANACASLTPTIAAGGNCTVNVTFAPTSIGAKTATLIITSNDGDTPTASVTLNGNGIDPAISISPIGPINFDPLLLGDTSPATQVTISNTGTTPLVVSSIAIGGTDNTQFAVVVGGANACASLTPTIAAGGNCTVNVTFAPTSTGAKTATLNVASNVSPASVTLNGTGIPAEISAVEGTIGTEIIIEGSNFGTKTGKVLIGDVAAKQAVKAKIAKGNWTDGVITCSVTKVPKDSPGTFDLTVQAKSEGATSFTMSNSFTVRLPAPDALTGTNDNGAQGVNINLTGDFFGTKKGKVYLEYRNSKGQDKLKSCKIISWGMNAITFQVPKLEPGIYPLSISNKVGNVLVGSFTIN